MKPLFKKSVFKFAPLCSFMLAIVLGMGGTGCDKLDSGTGETEQGGASMIERAEQYRRLGQYRAALIEARNAIKAAPDNYRGPLVMAKLFNDVGNGKEAIKALEMIPPASASEVQVMLAHADALLLQRKFRSVLDRLRNAPDTDPEFAYRIAQAKAGLGQHDAARRSFRQLLQSPRAIDARNRLAALELQQQNTDASIALLQQVLDQQPNNIDALTLSARIAEKNGELEKAEQLLSRALMELPQTDLLLPQKNIVLQSLIPILTKLGRSTESLIYSKTLTDANPEGAELQNKFRQAVEAWSAGKVEESETLLQEVYDQSSNDYAGMLLGMIKYRQGKYAEASRYLTAHVDPEVAPDDALRALAATEVQLRQPEKLLEVFTPEQRSQLKDPSLMALVGIALVQSGEQKAGEKMLLDALRLAPDQVPVRATLARHYILTRQTDKAIALLSESPASESNPELARLLVTSQLAASNKDAALATAQRLAATKPEQATNYQILGRTALITKQYDVSENALQHALQLQANHLQAKLDLAQLMLLRERPQQAEKLYDEIIAADNNNANAIKGLIRSLLAQGGSKAGAQAIEAEVLKRAPTDIARAVMAEYHLASNRTDDAKRLLDPIQETQAKSYPGYVRQLYALVKSRASLAGGDITQARQAAFDGLRVNPQNIDLLMLLGRIELKAGSFTEAEKIAQQIARIKPDSPALLELRGSIAAANGDKKVAAENFRQLWNKKKDNDTGLRLYQALAGTDEVAATRFLDEWQTALPNSDAPHFFLGMKQHLAGDLTQAIRHYETAIRLNAQNALALNNLAALYAESGNTRAVELAQRAYQLQPKNAAIVDTYGWSLVKSGQVKPGVSLLEKALALAPDSTEIKTHLEQARAQL